MLLPDDACYTDHLYQSSGGLQISLAHVPPDQGERPPGRRRPSRANSRLVTVRRTAGSSRRLRGADNAARVSVLAPVGGAGSSTPNAGGQVVSADDKFDDTGPDPVVQGHGEGQERPQVEETLAGVAPEAAAKPVEHVRQLGGYDRRAAPRGWPSHEHKGPTKTSKRVQLTRAGVPPRSRTSIVSPSLNPGAGTATVPKEPGQNTRCGGQVVTLLTPGHGSRQRQHADRLVIDAGQGDNRLWKAGPIPEEPYAE